MTNDSVPRTNALLNLEVYMNREGLEGYGVFVVEIPPTYARYLLEKIKLLQALKVADPSVYTLEIWDYSGEYFARDWDREDDEVRPRGEALRTECNLLSIREDEVSWHCIAKHTNVECSSESVTAAELAQIAEEVLA